MGAIININARSGVAFDGKGEENFSRALTTTQPGATGKAGDIQIATGTFTLTNGAYLSSSTDGKGDGGNITIDARDAVTFDNNSVASSNVSEYGVGRGGNIELTTGTVTLTNGSQLSTSVLGQGNAGNITVNARDAVNLGSGVDYKGKASSIDSILETNAFGKAGDIQIATGSLGLTNGALLSNSSDGRGNAGDITVNARDTITIEGEQKFLTTDGTESSLPSNASSALGSNGIGNGGNIRINGRALFLKNGGYINASSAGQGNAGKIAIVAQNTVAFDGIDSKGVPSGAISELLLGGAGKGGDIQITTNSLSVTNGAQLLADTAGQGNGGNITIDAGNTVKFDGVGNNNIASNASSTVSETGFGNAGNILLTTDSLSLTNGGKVNVSTFGQGNAGDITIDARDAVTLDSTGSNGNSSGVFSLVGSNGVGKGGNIRLTSNSLGLNNNAYLSAQTSGNGDAGNITVNTGNFRVSDSTVVTAATSNNGNAGNITLQAGTLTLDNQASISAQTASSTGGNINLDLGKLLLLRRASQISTTAGTANAGGDGGNITINSPFIIAIPNENSDITANAFQGRGGNVKIGTQGIFGIQQRSKPTAQSDITASSQLGVQGQVTITQPNVQPEQGLVELPASVLDASNQIAQVCPNGANASRPLGEFIVTGRGSLPPNPLEPLAGSTSLSPLASIDGETQTNISLQTSEPALTATPTTIVEAQGWVKTADGKIALVASAPQATPNATTTQATCPVSK